MNKKQRIIYYVLLVILTVLFVFSGFSKLSGNAMAVAGFASVGLPLWFMYVIGIGEVLGPIGLWTRRFFRYAYEGMFIILTGAIVTTAIFQSVTLALFPLVVAIILGIVVWLHNKK